jgi:hypothetical protein
LSNNPYDVKRVLLKTSHFELNSYFDSVSSWTAKEIESRGSDLVLRALKIWPDVGRDGATTVDAIDSSKKPVAIRYKDKLLAVSTWKEGSLKLLELFEEAKPGILASLVADGQLPNELSKDPNRFFRSKMLVGGVYFNSHASGSGLKRKLKRIAERVGVKESEYGFVFENDS